MQSTAATQTVTVDHPLDPLTAGEITAAATILRHQHQLGASVRFVRFTLHEPPKERVWSYRAGDPCDRQVLVIVRETSLRTTFEALVSLGEGEVVDWRELQGVQPPITYDEFLASNETIRADSRWQAAMRKRGVTEFELAMIDPWSSGHYSAEDSPRRRTVRALTWIRTNPDDNGYARPIEGLLTLFDLDEMKVVQVEDHGVVPLPPKAGNYSADAIRDPNNVPCFADPRPGPRPLEIRQPEGVSFTVQGREVTWEKWRFRVGFSEREGLVLHTVAYEDKGRRRPILHRAALSEMLVPYGDPSATHWRKNAFDEGEYGIGMLANALELGCDCLGEIYYFDAVVADTLGEPRTLPNAICLHEEDYGILWKHTDLRTGKVEVRRSRRLVLSSISTIGNYEYGFFWYFYQDGTIEYQVKLTGIISTGALEPGVMPEFGQLVAPGLYGPNHQHFFNVRLDMMVDGVNNSVYEVDSVGVPAGPRNPHGNAWVARSTPLASEAAAQRIVEPLKGRYWKVVNPSVLNALGEPVAYKLVPGDNILPFFDAGVSPIPSRAAFITKHLWVTHYDPAELYAAGDYPNQHPGGAGLPAYTAGNRSIEDTDIVLWYTAGAHHIVRPEDWPVAPVSYIGFHLKPVGFFDGNPALDIPPPGANGPGCHA